MFLTVKPPNGFIQSYDLGTWPAWSLELAVVRTGSAAAPAIGIALALRGPMNGAPLTVPLVVLDLKHSDEELPEVRHISTVQYGDSDKKARLREFLNVLNNNSGMKAAEVEQITTGSGLLIDAANAFMNGLWSYGAEGESLGPIACGNQLGWNWAVTRTRFESSGVMVPQAMSAITPEESPTIISVNVPDAQGVPGKHSKGKKK